MIITTPVAYGRVTGPGTACIYNEYYDYIPAPNEAGADGSYSAGKAYCNQLCSNDTSCQGFFYYKSDPAYRNQGNTAAYCLPTRLGYRPELLQCNVPFVLYYVGYGKIFRQ